VADRFVSAELNASVSVIHQTPPVINRVSAPRRVYDMSYDISSVISYSLLSILSNTFDIILKLSGLKS
jgi:hypothetical protein